MYPNWKRGNTETVVMWRFDPSHAHFPLTPFLTVAVNLERTLRLKTMGKISNRLVVGRLSLKQETLVRIQI